MGLQAPEGTGVGALNSARRFPAASKASCCSIEALVECPKGNGGQKSGGEKMKINPAEALTEKLLLLHQNKYLFEIRFGCTGKVREQGEDFPPVPQASACQFPDDVVVTDNDAPVQKIGKLLVAPTQMIDPHRSIDQETHAFSRRRCGRSRSGSVLPRRASLRALSNAIRASSPR